ncbi:MAG: hypothetical protein L0H23_07325, partial [Luteimonas sp.]|nr:hypothetical protein [Luteimonas sp.]
LLTVAPAIAKSAKAPATRNGHTAAVTQQALLEPDVAKTRSAAIINVTAAQAARAARHEYGGKVLGVQLEDDPEKPYYRVRLISRGRIHVVSVNAHK